jgi:hypothetical protein
MSLSHTIMRLSNQQWDDLQTIFLKNPPLLDGGERDAFLIPIARSVGKKIHESPFARWLSIPGADDFFEIMRELIQSQQEPLLEKSLVLALLKRSLAPVDQNTLNAWLKQTERNPPTKQVPPANDDSLGRRLSSDAAKEVLQASIQVFNDYEAEQKKLLKTTITNTLRTAKDLASNLIKSGCLQLQSTANEDAIAESLLSHDFPIKLLDDIVTAWSKRPKDFLFVAQDASEFDVIKETLVMESLPSEDRKMFRHALIAAKHSMENQDLSQSIDVRFGKNDNRLLVHTEMLIRKTWLILTLDPENVSDALRLLLNPKNGNPHDRTRLLAKVQFLKEPPLENDSQYLNGINERDVAQKLLDVLDGEVHERDDPVEDLKRDLQRISEEDEIVVMIIPDKRKLPNYLSLLNKSFPSVKCIGLSPSRGTRYSDVTRHLVRIGKAIPYAYVMQRADDPPRG